MTLVSNMAFAPRHRENIITPSVIAPADVSIIMPVRDNQAGVDRFLTTLFNSHEPHQLPLEVIVVDNNSRQPIVLNERYGCAGSRVSVVRCPVPGPAAARNAGARSAVGRWLLFADSDCIPTKSMIAGYIRSANGAVGYAGRVCATGEDRLSRYYDSQEILISPEVRGDDGHPRPHGLITANALVWKSAFDQLGGFDERFPLAAGEDVDLGFRLSEIGSLSYALESVMLHDFECGWAPFVRRFVRYGGGNRALAEIHGIDLSPRPFRPVVPTPFNFVAAAIQFISLSVGYRLADRQLRRSRGPRGCESTIHVTRSARMPTPSTKAAACG